MIRPPNYDHTAGWEELPDFLLSVCEGAGKTVAGQENRPGSIRARREIAVEAMDGDDTELQRRTPATEWKWRATLLIKYPGRGAKDTLSGAMRDAEPVAKALTTANPKRGWRVHVAGVRARVEGPDLVVRLLVDVERVYWYVGAPVGQNSGSPEAESQEEP